MRDFLITSYEQMPVLLAFLLHIDTGYGYGMKRSLTIFPSINTKT